MRNPTENPKCRPANISPLVDDTITFRLPSWSKDVIREFSIGKKQSLTRSILDALNHYKPLAKLYDQKITERYEMIVNASEKREEESVFCS